MPCGTVFALGKGFMLNSSAQSCIHAASTQFQDGFFGTMSLCHDVWYHTVACSRVPSFPPVAPRWLCGSRGRPQCGLVEAVVAQDV